MHYNDNSNIPFTSATTASHPAMPTVARDGTNSIIVDNVPFLQNCNLKDTVLDKILLAYKKYLLKGSLKAKRNHNFRQQQKVPTECSDGGHYILSLCYAFRPRFNPTTGRTQLEILIWLSSVPYISADAPFPKGADLDDDYASWMAVQDFKQVRSTKRNLRHKLLISSGQAPSDESETDEDTPEWHATLERIRKTARAEAASAVPKGYRPMLRQEVEQLFSGYMDAIRAELELYFQEVYRSATAQHIAPDYYGYDFNFIPALNNQPSLRQ